jgi:hypothetical protein
MSLYAPQIPYDLMWDSTQSTVQFLLSPYTIGDRVKLCILLGGHGYKNAGHTLDVHNQEKWNF